jgi:starvation-inducible DNA-binding protein
MSKNTVEKLKTVLADTYTLYLKTQNYHWNVTGPSFQSLHLLFETQYNDLFLAVDLVAERIRSLGSNAPGSFSAFLALSNIKEAKDKTPDAESMVKELAKDQEVIVKSLSAALKEAQKAGDEATIGLLVDRITAHEKNAWILKSSI